MLEKWEFLKDYKYSVIFTCNDFSSTLKKAKEIIPLENTYENDYLYTSFVKICCILYGWILFSEI